MFRWLGFITYAQERCFNLIFSWLVHALLVEIEYNSSIQLVGHRNVAETEVFV
jgi:hypothetical protein